MLPGSLAGRGLGSASPCRCCQLKLLQLPVYGSRHSDLRHDFAVWQGYGLFGPERPFAVVSWLSHCEMPRVFCASRTAQVILNRPSWSQACLRAGPQFRQGCALGTHAGGCGRTREISNLKGIGRQGYGLGPARICFKPQLRRRARPPTNLMRSPMLDRYDCQRTARAGSPSRSPTHF